MLTLQGLRPIGLGITDDHPVDWVALIHPPGIPIQRPLAGEDILHQCELVQ